MPNLYSDEKLRVEGKRLKNRMGQIYYRGFKSVFTEQESQRLGTFILQYPLIGYHQHPLDFYANSETRSIFLPILSLLFLEDLCTAYAWLWANQYSLETIDEYVTMVKYDLTVPPLQALQIPQSALTNVHVNELSLRFRNSAYAFILAHELGHIYHTHRGYVNVSAREAQENEKEADLFALTLMSRTATIPMGVLLWFQANNYYLPNRGDFRSDAEWERFLAEKSTHPLTSDRLHTLSDWLNMRAFDFVKNETDKQSAIETIHFIANGARKVAEVLEDIDIHRMMAAKAQRADLFSLTPRRLTSP